MSALSACLCPAFGPLWQPRVREDQRTQLSNSLMRKLIDCFNRPICVPSCRHCWSTSHPLNLALIIFPTLTPSSSCPSEHSPNKRDWPVRPRNLRQPALGPSLVPRQLTGRKLTHFYFITASQSSVTILEHILSGAQSEISETSANEFTHIIVSSGARTRPTTMRKCATRKHRWTICVELLAEVPFNRACFDLWNFSNCLKMLL